jgi:hypothetical protein
MERTCARVSKDFDFVQSGDVCLGHQVLPSLHVGVVLDFPELSFWYAGGESRLPALHKVWPLH